jgi:hypothetical protein
MEQIFRNLFETPSNSFDNQYAAHLCSPDALFWRVA